MIEAVQIPEGSHGPWTVKHIVVSEAAAKATQLRAMIKGRGYVPPGSYTQLYHQSRGLIMSDTPDERRDHWEPVHRAHGHVLINGLGIGMVLAAVLKKPDVTDVTIVN